MLKFLFYVSISECIIQLSQIKSGHVVTGNTGYLTYNTNASGYEYETAIGTTEIDQTRMNNHYQMSVDVCCRLRARILLLNKEQLEDNARHYSLRKLGIGP